MPPADEPLISHLTTLFDPDVRRLKDHGQIIGSTVVPAVIRFLRDESGATAIEYAVIASGVAVAIASTIVSLGSSVKGLFTSVSSAMK